MRPWACLAFALLIAACGGGIGSPDDASVDAAEPDASPDAAPPPDASVDASPECQVDTDCGLHEVCETAPAPHACLCADGYAANASGACAWVGVVANPGFTTQAGWTTHSYTEIDPARLEVGMVDPGAAEFFPDQEDPDCVGGRLYLDQTIRMPRRSRAEPLVVEASYLTDTWQPLGPTFGIGRVWHAVDAPPGDTHDWVSARSCLGAGEYAPESSTGRGAPLRLAIELSYPDICLSQSHIYVDHVDVVPAAPGECPAPGEVLNGDAEGSGRWTFYTAEHSTAGLVDGVGAGGSRGLGLHLGQRCEAANGSVLLSIPTDMTSPALSFYAASPSTGDVLWSQLGERFLPPIAGASTATHRVCVPRHLRGTTTTFLAQLQTPYDSCDTALDVNAAVDDVVLADDPSCGTDPYVADGGFESYNELVGGSSAAGSPTPVVLHDAARAHGGQGVLQLAELTTCSWPRWSVSALPPPSAPGAGPALTYYYKFTAGQQVLSDSGSYGTPPPLVGDGAWHRRVLCFNPRDPYRERTFSISIADQTPVTCGQPIAPAAVAYVDDVVVATDPSCPTQ